MNWTALLAQEEADAAIEAESGEACAGLGPFCDRLLDWTGNETLAETTTWLLGTPLKIGFIVVVAMVVNRIARRLIRKVTENLGTVTASRGEALMSERAVERAEQRASTIGSLLRSLSSGIVYGIAAIMIIELLGVSIVPILASAGILGLAVGFGAQSVVADLFGGLFMLAEDQFGVGDRVDIGTVNGYVERLTLRTTVIRDPNGTLWHVPNSKIAFVANENQLSSRAVIEIGVSYQADAEAAMAVLLEAAQAACDEPDWRESVSRPAEVSGVQELGEDAVVIRVQAWVAAERWRVFQRHLRLRLKQALDAAGIEMPNRQVDVWMRGDTAA